MGGKTWAVCFDSDGCVMDTMTHKHKRCFGPCLVREWGLEDRREEVLRYWNSFNLYSASRGVNRFVGLIETLEAFRPREGWDLAGLKSWTETSPELSNAALARAAAETGDSMLEKALSWSRAVNRAMEGLPSDLGGPFPGAAQGVRSSAGWANVAVVSSANRDAVEGEWRLHGLLEHVDDLMTQECGSKAACIGRLIGRGYDRDRVLMVGDAPGDREAALENGALFYPILAGKEAQSWADFAGKALPLFRRGLYRGEAMEREIKRFESHLKGERTHG